MTPSSRLLEELVELEKKASAAPWERDSEGKYDSGAQEHYIEHFLTGGKDRIVARTTRWDAQEWSAGCHGVFDDLQARADLDFIAALRNAFPAIVSALADRDSEEITFNEFRRANVARCLKWHPAGIGSWSPSDWLTAVTGELGELASLIKMRNRERDGLRGNKFSPTDKQIADEIADVFTYLDLLAEALGINLGKAAVDKFNAVSERNNFPDRIRSRIAPPAEKEG